MYQHVTEVCGPLYSPVVEWETIRAHYERLFRQAKRERHETQQKIAGRVGLEQNAISRLLRTRGLGPQVETVIKAIEGLGYAPSVFFAQIEERHGSGTIQSHPQPGEPHARAVQATDPPSADTPVLHPLSPRAFVDAVRAVNEADRKLKQARSLRAKRARGARRRSGGKN